jgi:hypothetical protein
MPLNYMTIYAPVHWQASLKVYQVTFLPIAQVGLFQRFLDGSYLMDTFFNPFNSQAGSIVGKAWSSFSWLEIADSIQNVLLVPFATSFPTIPVVSIMPVNIMKQISGF